MNNIGSSKEVAKELFRRFGLTPFREKLRSSDFDECAVANIQRAVRKRAAPPEVLTWLMMYAALTMDSFAAALRRGWMQMKGLFEELPDEVVTPQAFSNGRKRLPVAFFDALFGRLQQRFRQNHDRALRWKGLRVMAGDGSALTLPEHQSLRKHFGGPSNQRKGRCPIQARLVAIVSVFTGFCFGFKLARYASSEQKLLVGLLDNIGEGDLLLLDRGFFGFGMFHAVVAAGAELIMRIQKHVKPIRTQKLPNGVVLWTIHTSLSSRRKWPGLPQELTMRFVRFQPKGFRPIFLLTSLSDAGFASNEDIAQLYFYRWRIETVYRELKHVLDIQGLRSTTPEGILKELYCQMMLNNIVRWLMQEAAEKDVGETGLAIKYSFKAAVEAVNEYVPMMLYCPVFHLPLLYQQLLKSIASVPVVERPGRSYPRSSDRLRYAKRRRLSRRRSQRPP
jgi:hypothetical protein